MGLNTNSNMKLWKDKAMIELNFAILYSFQVSDSLSLFSLSLSRSLSLSLSLSLVLVCVYKKSHASESKWSYYFPVSLITDKDRMTIRQRSQLHPGPHSHHTHHTINREYFMFRVIIFALNNFQTNDPVPHYCQYCTYYIFVHLIFI